MGIFPKEFDGAKQLPMPSHIENVAFIGPLREMWETSYLNNESLFRYEVLIGQTQFYVYRTLRHWLANEAKISVVDFRASILPTVIEELRLLIANENDKEA